MNYVIIGNATAAVGAVEGIRRLDDTGKITIVSEEPYHTYSRPLISYLLQGKVTQEKMRYRPDDFYSRMRCELLFDTALSIDDKARTVALKGGAVLLYDKLLLATGSRPLLPPIPGLDSVERKTPFLCMDDALRLEGWLTPSARVLIIGAGLIGLKCAEGIADRVGSVTVVDLADRVLPAVLDARGAAMVQTVLEEHGIAFHLTESVASLDGNKATLRSGAELEFDILVVAAGVRPRTELLSNTQGAVDRGILTDEYQQTLLPDIYAAGDCAQSMEMLSGQRQILAILPNAYRQGETAGQNMAGADVAYEGLAMNAVGFFGLHMVSAGSPQGQEIEVPVANGYKKLYVKDHTLRGFMLIGDIERAGIYTQMIRTRQSLQGVDPALWMERPQLAFFPRKYIHENLGGLPHAN